MVAPVLGTTAAGSAPPAGSGKGSASSQAAISSSQFLKILTTELTSQDPLSPLSSSDFIQQMVGIQSLQETASLTDSLNSFTQFMQMSSGSSLIGKSVTGLTADGQQVQGLVSSVVIQNGAALLVVGGQQLPVSGITQIDQ
jgi:flagellar basal-body rod modification protein FlgD